MKGRLRSKYMKSEMFGVCPRCEAWVSFDDDCFLNDQPPFDWMCLECHAKLVASGEAEPVVKPSGEERAS
jgi:transcription initiation factor IIE alpha subunit